jgi:hypothetical protein
MNFILRQFVRVAVFVVPLLVSGCYVTEGVFVEAGRPGVAIPQSEAGVTKEVSDQVAKELDLVPTSDAEVAAFKGRLEHAGIS